jgi:hypothetical protein
MPVHKYSIIILFVCGLLSCQSKDKKTTGKILESQSIPENGKKSEGKTTKKMEVLFFSARQNNKEFSKARHSMKRLSRIISTNNL